MSNSLHCQEISKRNKREERRKDNKEEQNEIVIERASWMKTLKYYYDRFRYYQFYVADKIETTLAIICMWIIKLYFSLMGYGPIFNDTESMIADE